MFPDTVLLSTTNATGESSVNVAVIVPFPAFTPFTVSASHFAPL